MTHTQSTRTAADVYARRGFDTLIRSGAGKTVPVDGTFALVTFDPTAYSERDVWLHAAGEPYSHGVWVGKVGAMVGHGSFGHSPEGRPFGAAWHNAGHGHEATALALVAEYMRDKR